MSDQDLTQHNTSPLARTGDPGTARIIYILYLVALAVGITGLVGVVMAYVNKDGAPEWLQSHYHFQIRTFWIGLLYNVIGLVTTLVLIGWVILALALVWFIIRCVKGLKSLNNGEAVPNPESWMFG